MMSRKYLDDAELEAALYEDDDFLCRDYLDPDLQSSEGESDVEENVVEANVNQSEDMELLTVESDKESDDSDDNGDSENESIANVNQSEDMELLTVESDKESDDSDDNGDSENESIVVPERRRPWPKAVIDQTNSDMVSPSGVVWKPNPLVRRRQIAANIMKEKPGLKQGIMPSTALESFRLFFDDEIIELIVRYSNQKLDLVKESLPRSCFIQNSRHFEKEEILGFIGFLITAGAYKQNKDPIIDMFTEKSLPIYRATLAKSRFILLHKCIRFDDLTTRTIRKENDNFTAAREIWDRVTSKFPNFLAPSESLVIDEELITFHGRCKFRLYIPTKPGNYGIEANVICDSENYYCFAAEPYTGKVPNQPKDHNSGPEVVKRLVKLAKLQNSGRNITMDRKFTSLPTTQQLFEENLTVVGTILSNRKDVPLELRPQALKDKSPGTIRFAFRERETLVSYVPKKNKVVTVLSTQHHDMQVRNDKPEMILYYNSTKAGVDTLDKCVRAYSCRRGTRRWPMAIFYNLIDISAYNSYIIFLKANENWASENPKRKSGRKAFLKMLGEELCQINMASRSERTGLPNFYITALKIFGFECKQDKPTTRGVVNREPVGIATRSAIKKVPKKGRCSICPRSSDRKYMKACSACEKYICPRHTASEQHTVVRKCTECTSSSNL